MNLKKAAPFFSLLLILGCATTIPTLERQQSLERIKEFPGLSKTDLYTRSLDWVARSFKSANDVIQLKDPENGRIIGQGLGSATFDLGLFKRHFRYTMIIDVKDGKMRVSYENIRSEQVGEVGGPDMNSQWKTVEKYFDDLSADLFASITAAEKKENW
jgi:hypothetical protein